jgi:hypothetical protein
MWPCIVTNFFMTKPTKLKLNSMALVHERTILTKPTTCTNSSYLFWKWNSAYFGQFLCPSSGVTCIHCTLSNGIYHTGLYTTFQQQQDQDGTAVPSWSYCSKAVYKPVWHTPSPSVQWITPDYGQRNCPKHVEFQFQNKFEKLVHVVGFVIRRPTDLSAHKIQYFNTR